MFSIMRQVQKNKDTRLKSKLKPKVWFPEIFTRKNTACFNGEEYIHTHTQVITYFDCIHDIKAFAFWCIIKRSINGHPFTYKPDGPPSGCYYYYYGCGIFSMYYTSNLHWYTKNILILHWSISLWFYWL